MVAHRSVLEALLFSLLYLTFVSLPQLLNLGDVRNDFYVTLMGGAFQQDNKTSAKNIEIVVRVLTDAGVLVENCMYRGNGIGGSSHDWGEGRTVGWRVINLVGREYEEPSRPPGQASNSQGNSRSLGFSV